ncbi:hypothetical protein L226DRAFT_193346 [Lentinus tigrinus ALCF2SS1-7]|uniref:Uncharacterized protein n=1 Tax=Lentinus tigrinus ALCF2SS1-6 TaxID=1328759 RepID=A0A5C2SR04_9APHY|nr:hypothetical protein L227DRAFT_606380 [Lentinus tigrinus ALCF2SS1-6]RPD80194.1 hypothetical protein L226DRAFT_193346 [Lentinus tigrinus ALCF2SS1-7]
MSASPDSRAPSEDKDEIDETAAEPSEAPKTDPQPKRKRGRPPGSKNKKTIAAEAAAAEAGSSAPPKRPRGRPPKRKSEEEHKAEGGEPSEPPPKKKRGRPPKNPRPEPTAGAGEASTSADPPKRKRGRPRKNSS